mgnify:CR=1 FL=1
MKLILPTIALAGLFGTCLAQPLGAAEEPASASPGGAIVLVTKATSACFSDQVRVTGFLVPRREALLSVEQEGNKVTDVLAKEGDQVTDSQDLIHLATPPNPQTGRSSTINMRSPAAGVVLQVTAQAGAMASPRMGPLMRISVGNEIELEAEVPSVHILKLSPGATARISTDDGTELGGRVRQVDPEIDRRTQLGKVRISVFRNPAIRVGMFARAAIDAARSCGVSIPRSAIDRQTVQVVKDNVVETRRVETGLVSDTAVEIRGGVREGEIIVANAGTSLHDGDRIKTIFADEIERTRGR